MALTIVVGGQYGSEGKGKVAYDFAKRKNVDIAVKVGGMNSGHTAYRDGKKYVFKTLPTPSLLDNVTAVIPSGAYFSVSNLFSEIKLSGLTKDRIIVDPYSVVITEENIKEEVASGLISGIGSTGSGTGSALVNRCLRNSKTVFAKDIDELKCYMLDTKKYMREALDKGKHIIVEGTQGFGLSLLHSDMYPFVTSRDTTAASVLSEVGLSPFDVTDVILTIRAFPIRVAGNSGELKNEITWEQVSLESGINDKIVEYTSVTKKIRRVGRFDEDIVKQAILVNKPSIIVLNHVDYIDSSSIEKDNLSKLAQDFLESVEKRIGRKVDYYGLDPYNCIER